MSTTRGVESPTGTIKGGLST